MEKAPIEVVQTQLDKFAPVTLTTDLSYLPDEEIQTIKLLVQAAQVIDALFLEQVSESNPRIMEELEKSKDPNDRIYLDFFRIMFGSWDRLEENMPLINTNLKPDGANFYPSDMTKKEFEDWLRTHPEDEKAFKSEFTVIRREGEKLVAIPYSVFYREKLTSAVHFLQNAAELTIDQSLKTYLRSRTDALLNNDYYQSDFDWMDLAGDIEVVIGPYEVYEDNLFGYKAAYESFVCVVDHDESQKLTQIERLLNDMEANLPIPERFKNFERGASSPIKVVNEIFTAGDAKAGIQTIAFNLPNDERVREAKGSKKVMLKNVMRAKFDKVYIPIARRFLSPDALQNVSFEGFFNHTLMHEISHGLGPGNIMVDGRETTVNRELKELYSTIEECKADVVGIYTTQFLIDKNVFPKQLEETLYTTFLGGMFRSVRFGIGEAHGGGVAIQLNYCLDKGAFLTDSNGLFSLDNRKIKQTIRDLASELLLIQANGDYEGAKAFIEKYRSIRPDIQAALENLKDVPVDIRPIFLIENEID
ncbi:MAG: peptidase [bacterium]